MRAGYYGFGAGSRLTIMLTEFQDEIRNEEGRPRAQGRPLPRRRLPRPALTRACSMSGMPYLHAKRSRTGTTARSGGAAERTGITPGQSSTCRRMVTDLTRRAAWREAEAGDGAPRAPTAGSSRRSTVKRPSSSRSRCSLQRIGSEIQGSAGSLRDLGDPVVDAAATFAGGSPSDSARWAASLPPSSPAFGTNKESPLPPPRLIQRPRVAPPTSRPVIGLPGKRAG
jgi:hypothetical protein